MPGRSSVKIGFLIFPGFLLLVLGASGFAAGCANEGSDQVQVINHSEPEAEADPEAEPDPEADPVAGVGPGVVRSPPLTSTQVKVALQEWAVIPEVQTIKAGETYFLADNVGPDDAHELVVIRTDLAPDELPVEDGLVPEDGLEREDEFAIIAWIEPFSPGSQASMVLHLEPGNYILICNIAEVEGGQLESHYQEGMFAAFTVED